MLSFGPIFQNYFRLGRARHIADGFLRMGSPMDELLVTGAGGFVGYTLLPELVRAGYTRLVTLDRKPLPDRVAGNLEELGAEWRFVTSDSIQNVPGLDSISTVICLAGATSVDAALDEPRRALEDNLKIAIDLAETARAHPRPLRAIYISSDEVLGASTEPLREDATLAPTQPYAASKAAAELILHTMRAVYNLDVVTLRGCNMIGPAQRPPKLVPVAVQRLLSGEPVPIHGSGEQTREWLAVEDFVSAIILLVRQRDLGGIFQAATGVHLSVNEVVAIAAEAIECPLRVTHVPDRRVQDKSYAMDPSRLRDLGWSPQINPRVAIARAARALASAG